MADTVTDWEDTYISPLDATNTWDYWLEHMIELSHEELAVLGEKIA